MSNVRKETLSGVKWQFLSKLTLQPVTFIFGMILARLIMPEEMGILGLTSIFFAVAAQLKDCGFGTALLRKQDRTEADINTVFWFNIGMSLVMSVLLCLAAPLFADIFRQPALVELTYVSAVMMFLNSSGTVHWTLYAARRDFKTSAIVTTVTAIIPMPFTIWAAFSGWSYWAIVLQGVLSSILSLLTIWVISPWKPRLMFSRESFSEFFGFGSKLLGTGLVNISYGELRNLIIGLFYSPAQLALFHRGYKLGNMPIAIVAGMVSSISLPILTAIQEDDRLFAVFRKYMSLLLIIVFWGVFTLVANATSLISTLYGEAWLGCVAYTQILVVGLMCNPITALISNLFIIKNRPGVILRAEIIIRTLGISLMIVASMHSIKALCIVASITGVVHVVYLIRAVHLAKWITYKETLADSLPYLIIAILCNVPAFIINLSFPPSYWVCAAGLVSSSILYAFIMQLRYDKSWHMLIELLNEKRILKYIPFLRVKPNHYM